MILIAVLPAVAWKLQRDEKRVAMVCVIVAGVAANFLMLYAGTAPKPFRTHLERVPFDERFERSSAVVRSSLWDSMDLTLVLPSLGRLRRWGVRWYVTPSAAPKHLEYFGLMQRYADTQRRVHEDPHANSLVFWEDGRSDRVEYQITTNRIQLRSSAKEAGRLCVNFLWHPLFQLRVDGQHSVEIRFHDQEFSTGLQIAAAVLVALAAHTVLWTRKS